MEYWLSLKSDNARGAVALCGAIPKLEERRRFAGIVANGHNALLATMLQLGYSPEEAALLMPNFEAAESLIGSSCLGLIFQRLIESFYKVKIDAILGSIIPHGEEITFSQLEALSNGKKLYIFNPASMNYYNTVCHPDMEVSHAILASILMRDEDIDNYAIFRTMSGARIDNIVTVTAYDDSPKFSTAQVLDLCKFFTKSDATIPKFAESILYHPGNIYIPITGLYKNNDLMRAGSQAASNDESVPSPSLVSTESESEDGFYVRSLSSDEFVVINQYDN